MPNQITFRLVRIVALAGLPEADPRATPPDPVGASVDQSTPGEMSTQMPYGTPTDKLPVGHSFYVRFTNGAPEASAEVIGPTVDVQPWVYDPGSTRWASDEKMLACGSSDIYNTSLIGTTFHRLSGVAGAGAATHIQLWVSDRVAI